MTSRLMITTGLAVLSMGSAALAQSTTETVTLKLSVYQPSLFDSAQRDTFKGVIDDRSATTTYELECSAGSSGLLGLSRIDETCAVKGSGVIKNPNNPSQTLQRINYLGGYKIDAKADGYVDATSIKAEYIRVGSVPAESAAYGGSLKMMPESPSQSATALRDALLKSLQEKATGTQAVEFSNEIDSIRFDNFTVPHVGQKDSVSCSWTGDAIYAYANDAWQMDLTARCGDKVVELEGNMPLVEGPGGGDYQDAYVVNLIVPGAGSGDPFAAPDPFATVDGITGEIRHVGSGRANEDGVYERVEVSGQLVGTGVPLEAVRSFAEIFVLLARTFEGA